MDDFELSRPPTPIEVVTIADRHARDIAEAALTRQRWRIRKLQREFGDRVNAFAATLSEQGAQAFRERLSAELTELAPEMERSIAATGMDELTVNAIVIVVSSLIIVICLAIIGTL